MLPKPQVVVRFQSERSLAKAITACPCWLVAPVSCDSIVRSLADFTRLPNLSSQAHGITLPLSHPLVVAD